MTGLLEMSGVSVSYRTSRGRLRAVDAVDLVIGRGETLGLVGESGCGKSSLGKAVVGLVAPESGSILIDGRDPASLGRRDRQALRRQVQMVFQDPMGALDPRQRIGAAIAEPLRVQGIGRRTERTRAVTALMSQVGLRPELADRLPHELSGGQRQRVGIARALALEPALIVCDEPVSALDLSLQAQVLNLLQRLQQQRGIAYLFISHDIAVIERVADRVAVMYLGRVVEITTADGLRRPAHPYTSALLASSPAAIPGTSRIATKEIIGGDLPSPYDQPAGCRFHTRCPHAMPRCRREVPALTPVAPGQAAACFLFADAAADDLAA